MEQHMGAIGNKFPKLFGKRFNEMCGPVLGNTRVSWVYALALVLGPQTEALDRYMPDLKKMHVHFIIAMCSLYGSIFD